MGVPARCPVVPDCLMTCMHSFPCCPVCHMRNLLCWQSLTDEMCSHVDGHTAQLAVLCYLPLLVLHQESST